MEDLQTKCEAMMGKLSWMQEHMVMKKQPKISQPRFSYQLWLDDFKLTDEYETIKAQSGRGPSKLIEISKKCGEVWQGMGDAQKQPYVEKYAELVASYRAAKAAASGAD